MLAVPVVVLLDFETAVAAMSSKVSTFWLFRGVFAGGEEISEEKGGVNKGFEDC